MRQLHDHDYPGNVRELEHVIEGAMNFIDDEDVCLRQEHLPNYFAVVAERSESVTTSQTFHDYMYEQERQYLQRALQEHHGNISQTAKAIGMSRQTLQYRIKKN